MSPLFIDLTTDKRSIAQIPQSPGVYLFKKGKTVLYIGKSIHLRARIKTHIESAKVDSKERAIVSGSDYISYSICDSEFTSLILESQLIQRLRPKYNARWKDDKSYLYIKVTINEEFPKIYATRKEQEKKALYFGPFPTLSSIEFILREIRRVIPFCMQRKISRKACFYSKLNLCSPCPNTIHSLPEGPQKKAEEREYRSNIRHIVKILKGEIGPVLKLLYERLKDKVDKLEFEEAIELRDRILRLEKFLTQASFNQEESSNRSVESLMRLLKLLHPFYPKLNSLRRIECYDVSNLSFTNATASMVVLTHGIIDKGSYRRFKIKSKNVSSDFEMLSEVIKRRSHNSWPRPDLIVVDGGKPQVRIIGKLFTREKWTRPLIGIAKNPDRLIIGVDHYPTIRPLLNDPGFNMVRQIRDESHRFARKYHLMLRAK